MIVLQRRGPQLLSDDRIAVGERTGAINRPGEYAKRVSAQEEDADARVRAGPGIDMARAFCRAKTASPTRAPHPCSDSSPPPYAVRAAPVTPLEPGTAPSIAAAHRMALTSHDLRSSTPTVAASASRELRGTSIGSALKARPGRRCRRCEAV
jgi:hypothetical protein